MYLVAYQIKRESEIFYYYFHSLFGSQENQKENPYVLHKETQQTPNGFDSTISAKDLIAINHHIKFQVDTSATPKIQSTQLPL